PGQVRGLDVPVLHGPGDAEAGSLDVGGVGREEGADHRLETVVVTARVDLDRGGAGGSGIEEGEASVRAADVAGDVHPTTTWPTPLSSRSMAATEQRAWHVGTYE